MTSRVANESPEQDAARRIVARVIGELEATHLAYRPAYRQIKAAGELGATTRESVIGVIASTATTLRQLAPSLVTTRTLPPQEQPDVALVLLRVLTDSLSVALAEHPAVDLMVVPDDVDELFLEVQAIARSGGASA
jgi:hypothetical protein